MSFIDFQEMTFFNMDCEVHYRYKKGTGNSFVILLHGAGCDHNMFEKQISAFDNTYNIIAWDARAHGLSKLIGNKKFNFNDMYLDSLKLFEIHSIEKAILIGQSMGGNLAQEIIYNHTELVSKCVLIDCTINTQKLSVIEKISLKMSRTIFNLYPWKTLIRQSANACGTTQYTRNYAQKCFSKIQKENFIDIMLSLFTYLHEDMDFKFQCPVLLLYGKNDITGNIRKSMTALAKNDCNCILRIIEKAAHNSNQDNPEAVNKNIKLFIEKSLPLL